jgi:hypothetical protein
MEGEFFQPLLVPVRFLYFYEYQAGCPVISMNIDGAVLHFVVYRFSKCI